MTCFIHKVALYWENIFRHTLKVLQVLRILITLKVFLPTFKMQYNIQ